MDRGHSDQQHTAARSGSDAQQGNGTVNDSALLSSALRDLAAGGAPVLP